MTARCSLVIANAGSGKTWTLANRIIHWSLEELRAGRKPEPARALAVTFTRKAAGEILARILSHAAQGASAGEEGAKARSAFEKVIGPATEAEYLSVLEALCAELHRLQIGTIDGFFHRIASAMPAEVGLPAEWTLGDDRALDELRAQAAATLLAHDEAHELIVLLESGEPKPSVTSAITRLLGMARGASPLDIYRATAIGGPDAMARAWNWIDTLTVQSRLTIEQFDELAARVALLVLPNTKGGTPDGRWTKAHAGLVAQLRLHDFRALAGSTFLRAMVEGASYQKIVMPTEFCELGGLLAPHLRKALVADLERQLKGARSVLPQACEALDRLQQEQGIFGFADVGRGVARAASRADSAVADPAMLRAILGNDIRDLAIDEAQDTSVEQFLSLRPLLNEVLTGVRGGRFLLVGDPKQSIYGWRGGTPGLIAHLASAYDAQLDTSLALTRSYRSAPLVMDLVNRGFGNLADDLLHLVDLEHKSELSGLGDWAKARGLPSACTESAFKRAVAAWPFVRHESDKTSLFGRVAAYACGKIAAAGNEPERELSACACAAAIAARLHRENGKQSIAVLVRKNSEVTETILELKKLGVPASDEGSATLLDSPAVARVVALLRLIDDPSDRISHFILSHGAMQAVTGLAPIETHPSLEAAHAAAQVFASDSRARIANEGLAAVLLAVFRSLRAQGLAARDEARIARVIALAEGVADKPLARLLDFIEAIAADKADSSSSDAVRVMTVHKSKGLEFDEVVLVSLDEGWGAAPTGWGMLVTSPTEPPRMVAPLANEEIREWVPELQLFERDERRRRVLDDLSSLYVAITRARHGVYFVVDAKQGGTLPTATKLIAHAVDHASEQGVQDALNGARNFSSALATAQPDSEHPFWTHESGQRVVVAPVLAPVSSLPTVAALSTGPLPVEVRKKASARATSPSSHAAKSLWSFDPFGDEDTALRGVLVHECFRELESFASLGTAESIAALVDRAAQRTSVEKGSLINASLRGEVAALLARLRSTAVAAALREGEGVSVRTELPFVHDSARGLVHGRIDRLELHRDGEGTLVGAVILDFKTGATHCDAAALSEKSRTYFEQLEGYAAAVGGMYELDRSAITLKLLYLDRGSVETR